MCNLSELVEERGIKKGITRERMLKANFTKDQVISCGYTEEEIERAESALYANVQYLCISEIELRSEIIF